MDKATQSRVCVGDAGEEVVFECCSPEASEKRFLVAGKLWHHTMWDETLRTNVLSMENTLEVSNKLKMKSRTLNYPRGIRGSYLSRE